MNGRLWLVLYEAFVWPARSPDSRPVAILECTGHWGQAGQNGLFLPTGNLHCSKVLSPRGAVGLDVLHIPVSAFGGTAKIWDKLGSAISGMPAAPPLPLIAIVELGDSTQLYHFIEHGQSGDLYLLYESVGHIDGPASFTTLIGIVGAGAQALGERQNLLSHRGSYWKWRPEFELERKYTFSKVPDTWSLITEMYESIRAGSLPGFVPEGGMEFQVFDYESILFEVVDEADEAGYISFIPQADGLVAVKRKWFQHNAELRREDLSWGVDLDIATLDEKVAMMTTAQTKRLTTFRRKRFDVNFESLETGHVFGIYLDICRDVEDFANVMSQCEVEYCRTRSLNGIPELVEEFEIACEFTRRFLEERNIPFEQNLYSKLDFCRESYARRNA